MQTFVGKNWGKSEITNLVYIRSNSKKVEPALLADETDVLVIEGLYAFNEQLGGMAVYATSATTRNLQMQQRAQTKGS